jgi:hypothetical protein
MKEAVEEKKEITVKEYLKYSFSDAELLNLSKTLAKHNQDLAEIEGQKKRVMADFGAKIQGEESNIGELSRKVSSGYEFRNIECVVTYHDPTQGKKTIVRTDTGEVVRVDVMSHSELQEQLPFAGGDSEEQPTA